MNLNGKNKSIIKRVISCIVCFAMILGMTPVTAHAAEDTYGYTIECCEGEQCNINMGHTVDGVTVNASPNVKYEYGTEDVNVFFQADEGAVFSGIVIKEDGVEKKFIKAAEVDNGYAVVKSCSYTIPTTDFGKNITIKVVNWEHPFDNEYVVNYGTEDNASIADNGGYLEGGMMCTFEVGSPITFTFTPPESSEEDPCRVIFSKNMADPVDVASELVANGDGTYTWTYAAEDAAGFAIDVIWTEAEASIRDCWDYMMAKDEAGEEYILVDYSYGNGGTVTVNENDKIAKQGYDNNYGMFIFEEEAVLELVVTPVDGGAINGIFINDEEVDLSNPELFDEATGTLKVAVDPSAEEPIWILIDFASNGYSAGYNEIAFDISYNGNHINSWKEYEFPEGEEAITLDIRVMEDDATLYGIKVNSDKNGVYCIKPEDIADAETEGLYHFVIDDIDDFYHVEIFDWTDENIIYDGYFKVDYNLKHDHESAERGAVYVNDELINSVRQFYDDSSINIDYKYTEGETIDFVLVPPAGIDVKPEKIAVCGFEEEYEFVDTSLLVAGEALEDGRTPYTFSYTPDGGFKLGIWWEEAQYDFDMCTPDWDNGQYDVYYWVNVGAEVLTIEDADETNNVVNQAQYREDGKVVLNAATDLKITIPESYRDKVITIHMNQSNVALDGTDDRYDAENGVITWFVNPEGPTDFRIDFEIPGIFVNSEPMEMTTTMNGAEVYSWEETPFPEGTVTLGFKPNDGYNLKGIRIRTADSPEYCVGFDEMEYDEESGQYLYVVPDTDIRYEISTVFEEDNNWTTKGEYVLYYEQSDDGYITFDGFDERIDSYVIYDYDSENTDSFDFIIHNPEWMVEAPYKVAYQINGYERVEVAAEDIVVVDAENGLYKYTFDMGEDAGKGFKLWVYWTEEQYIYEMLEPGDEQSWIQCFVSNGPVPNITANDGEGDIAQYLAYDNRCKVIYNFNYNDNLCENEGDYYSLFQIPLDENLVVDRICIDGWDEVSLDGNDERYNPETKTLTLKIYNGEWRDVNIDYKFTGYNLWFDTNEYTVSVNGDSVDVDTEYSFGDATEYTFVFAPVDNGENTRVVYGIKIFTGEGESQTVSYISAEDLTDEGDGAYSYTVTDTQEWYRFEIINWEGCVFDNQYKIGYDEAYNAIKIGDEGINPWENYSYADFTVNEDGTVTFAIDIYPQANEEGIESPFGIIVDVNDWSRDQYYCNESEPSFVDNGDYYTFTYTMQDFCVGAGVTFMVYSTSEEFNYETCVPYMDGQYQLDYDANVENIGNVISNVEYSDTGNEEDVAYFGHASYRDRGRIVLDREQTLTFTVTPEAGKILEDVIVDGGSVMDSVTDNGDGTYTYSITVWNGYAPSIHFEFADGVGYKVYYNPEGTTIIAALQDGTPVEPDVNYVYPEGTDSLTINFIAQDGYNYTDDFSGIKVVQKNLETNEDIVTFVKKSELDKVYDDNENELVGTYGYTINDTSVLTEIMVVDWKYPFDGEYVVHYDRGYDANITVSLGDAEYSDVEPGEINDYGTAEVISFKLTPPSDFDTSFVENDSEEWKNQLKFYVTENENENLQRINYVENFTYDSSTNTFTMPMYLPENDRGMVFEVFWTSEEECYKTMEPNPDSYMSEYGIGYTGNSYGNVTVEQSEVTLLEYQTFRDNGKVRTEIVEGVEPIVAVKITPDANSKLGDICLGEDSLTSGGTTPITGCEGVSYDVASDTYTYMWNLNDGYLHIEFDEETEKTIGVSATTKGTLTDVYVSGTAKNVDIVDVEIKDANLTVLASKTGVSVEDGKFTCEFTGLELTHAKAYIVIVTDASDNKNVPADFAEGFFNACNGHIYAYKCTDTICAVCGDERTDAPGHRYTSDCDTTCNNCADGTGVREPLADHSYNNQCTDTVCTVCGIIRHDPPGHSYTSDCDTTCDVCTDGTGDRETSVEHSYNNQCTDTECIVCGDERTDAPGHSYTSDCDAFCDVCTDGTGDREPLADHSYSNQCTDTICIECGDERTEAPGHHYSYICQTKCDNCTDGSGDRVAAAEHTYNNQCTDTECADCGEERVAPGHSTSGPCDEVCNECSGALTPSGDHVYDGCEDTICNVCSKVREAKEHKYTDCTDTTCDNDGCTVTREAEAEHKYTDCTDTTCDNEGCTVTRPAPGHTTDGLCDKKCNVCDASIDTIYDHTYSGCEDTDCDVCGETRTAGTHEYADCEATDCENCEFGNRTAPGHKYTDCVDTSCDNDGCTYERTDAPGHDVDGDCDEKCDVCNGALTPSAEHTYSGCEDTECDVCGKTRTALAHKYTDCDDTTCDNDGCDETRTALAHKYTDCADTTCNTCNKTRTAPGHSYAGQTWLKDENSHWQKCANCSATSTKEAHKMVEQADGSSKCSVCGHIVECEEVPNVTVSYRTHIQSFGWEKQFKTDGEMSGTSGKAKRLEGIEIKVASAEAGKDVDLGIQYTTHCQSYGWLPWSADGDMNGTEGEAKRLEAIKIQLTGEDADEYDIYYRVHAQSYGWLGWASNGAAAGTAGLAKRLEGIQIVVVKKGETFDKNMEGIKSADTRAYVAKDGSKDATVTGANTPNITYRTHVQKYGWQAWKYNGVMSGTSGESKRLEGIEIKLTNQDCEGSIVYTTHVQKYGWQGEVDKPETWVTEGKMSGTSGEAKRLEAICIQLTGEMAEKYDVYYRVHAQTYGWLSWASNGAPAGTAGYAKRLEGIQIVIVPKGEKPSDTYQGVTSTNPKSYIEK